MGIAPNNKIAAIFAQKYLMSFASVQNVNYDLDILHA
jgi:hypothetical protein